MNRAEKDGTVVYIWSVATYRSFVCLVRRSGIHAGPNSNSSPGRCSGATRPTRISSGSGPISGSSPLPGSVSRAGSRPLAGGYTDGRTP